MTSRLPVLLTSPPSPKLTGRRSGLGGPLFRGRCALVFWKGITKRLTLVSALGLTSRRWLRSSTSQLRPGARRYPFCGLEAAPDLAAPVLLRVFEAISNGHPPPDGFNHGLLYLLPKKDTGLLSDTRPLSVTNTDNRVCPQHYASCQRPG